MTTRRPDDDESATTLRVDPPARTRKGTVVDPGLAERIAATHVTEVIKDIAYYQGDVFNTLLASGDTAAFAQDGVRFYTNAYNYCGNLLRARGRVSEYCELRLAGDTHEIACQKILATLAVSTVIVADEGGADQTTIAHPANGDAPDATFVEEAKGFDAFDPRWDDSPGPVVQTSLPVTRNNGAQEAPDATFVEEAKGFDAFDPRWHDSPGLVVRVPLPVSAQKSLAPEVSPAPAPSISPAAMDAVVRKLSGTPDDSRAETVLEVAERGDRFFSRVLDEQGAACLRVLISEGFSEGLAREGVAFYCHRLRDFAIAVDCMKETRIYCQLRRSGFSIPEATREAQKKPTERDLHNVAIDPKIEQALIEDRQRSDNRKKILAALGVGVVIVGILGGLYYWDSHNHPSPVETQPTIQP